MSKEKIIGKNPVIEVLNSDRKVFSVSILDKLNKKTADEIYEAAKIKNVTVQRVSRDKLDDLAHGKHQGIIATVESYDYAELEDLFDLAKSRDEQPILIKIGRAHV